MISEPWPVDNIAEHKLRININTKMIVHSCQKTQFHWARAVCYHSTHKQMMSSKDNVLEQNFSWNFFHVCLYSSFFLYPLFSLNPTMLCM